MGRHRFTRLLAVAATALTTVVITGTGANARVVPDGGPNVVIDGDVPALHFEIAHNPERNEYFAVWERNPFSDVDGNADVVGQRLDADGVSLGAPLVVAPYRLPSSSQNLIVRHGMPKVAYNALTDQYLVTYTRAIPVPAGADYTIRGQVISDEGALTGSEAVLVEVQEPSGCSAQLPDIAHDPSTGGYVLSFERSYLGPASCSGLANGEAETVVQVLSGSLVPGVRVDFPNFIGSTKNSRSEVVHNPVTNQIMVTQPYGGSHPKQASAFPAQIYTSELVPVGGLKEIEYDPALTTVRIELVLPVADPVTGNWFVASRIGTNRQTWTNLLSPSGESLRTATLLDVLVLKSAVSVGDGSFVLSTGAGTIAHVRADGTEIHSAMTAAGSKVNSNAIAMGVGGSGVGIGVGVGDNDVLSYGFDVVAPGALPLSPARLLDTRVGADFPTIDGVSQGRGKVPAGEFVELKVAARGGVPADASAVLLNVAAAGASSGGFVTAYPCDASTRPTTSNLNYAADRAASAAAIAKVSKTGTVCLFTSAGAHLIVDVNGFVPAGGSVSPVVPARLLETRSGAGAATIDGVSQSIGRRSASQVTTLKVAGRGGIADKVDAVLVNVTAINPSGSTFLTVYPCDATRPTAANLNAADGSAVNNLVTSKVAADGTICVFSSAATDLVVDVAAFVPSMGGLLSVVPARLLETRTGAGNTTVDGKSQGIGCVKADSETKVTAVGRGGVSADATGVMLNVAYINPDTGGFMTAYPCGTERPKAANLNFAAGDVGSNAVFVKIGTSGQVCIYSTSASDLAVDVVGHTVDM